MVVINPLLALLQLPPQRVPSVAPHTGIRLRAMIWVATACEVCPVRGLCDSDCRDQLDSPDGHGYS